MASEREPLLEHALIFALFRLADRPTLVRLLEDPRPRAQQAALTLLDQAPHRSLDANAVVRRVGANDESLRRTALAILQKHPEWGAAAEPLIRQMMYRAELNNSERGTLRDLLLAFQNDPVVQTLIPSAMAGTNLPAGRRVLLLETIARSTIAPVPVGWVGAIEQALHSDDLDVCLQAVRTTELGRINKLDAALKDLAIRTNLPAELRLTALRSVLPRQPQLQPAIFEFLPGDDERLRATVNAISEELTENGFVLRYHTDETDDGLSGKEGTFLICSFWLVSALAIIGEHQRARDLMERLLRIASPLGLYAEEFDADTGRHLGNFPQAFSHLALMEAAARIIVPELLDQY